MFNIHVWHSVYQSTVDKAGSATEIFSESKSPARAAWNSTLTPMSATGHVLRNAVDPTLRVPLS